jgi:sigma-B regulation protein RsbU (phosphoserine phosphatase)
MRDPAAVMGGLNDMFQMDSHNGMFFTMWYGVYDTRTRTLRYSCGGHHAAYLVPHDRNESTPLKTAGLMVGAAPDVPFRTASATVPAGAALYLFSDGVFEVVTKEQTQWRLQDFLPVMMAAPAAGESDAERIYRTVKTAARSGPLDDDFSILIVTFA